MIGGSMKKIIPFKKQIYFKTNVGEITSISLEHTLLPVDNSVKGEFIITGDYKMTESSMTTDPFEFNIPCDIELSNNYKLDNVEINIDDFYYEVIDSKILEVNIDVLLDKLEEKDIINEIPIKHTTIEELEEDLKEDLEVDKRNCEEIEVNKEVIEEIKETVQPVKERCVEEEEISNNIEITKSIFTSFNSSEEEYRMYRVYIVREGDSIDKILTQYQITKEELEKYNDLKEIAIGDKIIIPSTNEDNQ